MIPVFSNTLGKEELEAIRRTFESRWLGPGEQREQFELELGKLWGVSDVLATNSCTSAIYIILKTLGIGPGDEVIIPSIHFVACLSAILELGATPIFCDVDPRTLNVYPPSLLLKLTTHTKAVVLLHYGGHPCDMSWITDLLPSDIYIIEDAATATASTYNGAAAGTLGDAGCWSFDSMKLLVTGDGGAMWFKDPQHTERAKKLRFLGLSNKSGFSSSSLSDRWWEYELVEPSGYFDMCDIAAAIGIEQIKKLPGFIRERQQVWELYSEILADVPGITVPPETELNCASSYYFYWIRVPHQRDTLARYLHTEGIYSTFRYYPLHLVARSSISLPAAEEAARTVLNIPIHQNISPLDVFKITGAIQTWADA